MPKLTIEMRDTKFQEVWYIKDWLCASEDKKCFFAGLACSIDLEFHNNLLYEVSVSPWLFKFVKDFLYHLQYYDTYAFRQIIHF